MAVEKMKNIKDIYWHDFCYKSLKLVLQLKFPTKMPLACLDSDGQVTRRWCYNNEHRGPDKFSCRLCTHGVGLAVCPPNGAAAGFSRFVATDLAGAGLDCRPDQVVAIYATPAFRFYI